MPHLLILSLLLPFAVTGADKNLKNQRYKRCDSISLDYNIDEESTTLHKPQFHQSGSDFSDLFIQPTSNSAPKSKTSPIKEAPSSKPIESESSSHRGGATTLYGSVRMTYPYGTGNTAPTTSVNNTEKYGHYPDNPVKRTIDDAVSTMSIDVDTGAYTNVRRFLLKQNQLPPQDAVRLEEMVNYFDYHYAQPTDGSPFAVNHSVIDSPWKSGAKLLRIGLQAKDIAKENLPPANIAFLIDTSGSMDYEDKLGLAKKTVCYFAANLREKDTITLISYAGYTREILPPTAGNQFDKIYDSIKKLSANGSTAGESAIRMGYNEIEKSYNPNGINRILLATDGDFNVGISDFEQLKSLVSDKRTTGISLTTLGFGTDNYQEQLMEQIADAGDGNYSYIDNLNEVKKVLDRQLSSTLATIAKDVKLQIEFNPETVKEYRLVGYENRVLNNEDFNNDQVDAGDIGAGHNVTAFYEFIPKDQNGWLDESRYQKPVENTLKTDEYAWLKLRYKTLNNDVSQLIEIPIAVSSITLAQADDNTRFGIAIASFAQALKGNKYNGDMHWQDIQSLAKGASQPDAYGLRKQAASMIEKATSLSNSNQ